MRVRYRALKDKCQIIIQDTGIGISQEEKATLFNKSFERGEDAKKVYLLGRGIGLFLASSIIKEHQGKVWAESQGKNKGSAFYIELPLGD